MGSPLTSVSSSSVKLESSSLCDHFFQLLRALSRKVCLSIRHLFSSLSPKNPPLPKRNYTVILEKAGLSDTTATALQRHVLFFADDNGVLTRESMQKAFQRLHFGKIKAFFISWVIFKGIASSTGSRNGAIPLKEIAKAMHLSDTGVYTQTGDFSPVQFDRLRQFAKIDPKFLTSSELAEMRLANKKREPNSLRAKIGAIASKAEFDLLLKLFGDWKIIDSKGTPSFAISFDRLRAFYANGPELFEEIASKPV